MQEKLNRSEFVVKKYRLAELSEPEKKDGEKAAAAPTRVMSEECLQKFKDSDPSSNMKYLDWMLFQAGGGQEAMAKVLGLWNGTGPEDEHSLRNQNRADFVQNRVAGYTENGVKHAPVSQTAAEAAWDAVEERILFESVMGDQDVAFEDGFGFYRDWPGKDGLYNRVAAAIRLWHNGLAKLTAHNAVAQRIAELKELKETGKSLLSEKDQDLLRQAEVDPYVAKVLELDLYRGWQPSSFSQEKAVYKNLEDLFAATADLRKQQVLANSKHEVVYEDDHVLAVCPLTVGASIRFGTPKWCTANRTEFDRCFDTNAGGTTLAHPNWKNYVAKGPLVYAKFKGPMPQYLSRLALHVVGKSGTKLTHPYSGTIQFFDMENSGGGLTLEGVLERIRKEHAWTQSSPRAEKHLAVGVAIDGDSGPSEEYRWGGRKPGRAWKNADQGQVVLASVSAMLAAVEKWFPKFDTSKIELDLVIAPE